ncbi:MAG: hypothetical protein WC506_04885 [Candidatus Micrarchaeia archaeon]
MAKKKDTIRQEGTRSAVWKLIDRDPSIRLDMERGLVNARALARYCGRQGIPGSEDAIISAIRRYPQGNAAKKQYDEATLIASQSTISTKSHIVEISLKKSGDVQDILPKMFTCISFDRGETLRLVQGEEAIKVIIDEKNMDKVMAFIPRKLVISVLKGLAEINMHLHPQAVRTPGIMLVLTGEFARNNINIYEITSCVPEMLFFVEEKDILEAYRVLFELCHGKPGKA